MMILLTVVIAVYSPLFCRVAAVCRAALVWTVTDHTAVTVGVADEDLRSVTTLIYDAALPFGWYAYVRITVVDYVD